MGLARVTAVRLLGNLVKDELNRIKKKEGIYDEDIATRACIHPDVIENVKLGNAELYRENEVRKLLKVLELSGKKRARAFGLLFVVHPTKRSIRSIPYKNRKHFIAGRNQFAPSSFSLR